MNDIKLKILKELQETMSKRQASRFKVKKAEPTPQEIAPKPKGE